MNTRKLDCQTPILGFTVPWCRLLIQCLAGTHRALSSNTNTKKDTLTNIIKRMELYLNDYIDSLHVLDKGECHAALLFELFPNRVSSYLKALHEKVIGSVGLTVETSCWKLYLSFKGHHVWHWWCLWGSSVFDQVFGWSQSFILPIILDPFSTTYRHIVVFFSFTLCQLWCRKSQSTYFLKPGLIIHSAEN